MKLCNTRLFLQLFRLVLVSITEDLKQQCLIPPDVIPTPNANLPGSQPIFSTIHEHGIARQQLDLLNDELSKSKGQSSIAQRSKRDLVAYLNPDVITDL